ncbi:MAG: DUF1588 domain-containing protein [Bdellovibrionales bacterium]|nr:DUF1588 domain-containing protein [Bdellovibrionales bacterium]
MKSGLLLNGILIGLVSFQLGCGAGQGFKPAGIENAPGTYVPPVKAEIPSYTADQLKTALVAASQKLVNRLPSEDEFRLIDEKGIDGYKEALTAQMESTRFRDAMRTYHQDYFATYRPTDDTNIPSINYNEPANMATYVIFFDHDYRELVTGDYCVNDNLATGACSAFQNDPTKAATNAAGVLTTRAFLNKWKSAYNFKRVKMVFEAFACSAYPDPDDQGMLPTEVSNVERGSTNDFNTQTGGSQACYQCHRSLNSRAVPYLNYTKDGFFFEFRANGTYPPSVPAEQRTVTDLADVEALPYMLLNTGTVDQPVVPVPRYKGREIPTIKAYGEQLANTYEFKHCMVRRFSNFMLGREKFDPLLRGLEPVLSTANSYNVKEILLDIATRPDFVLR